MPRHVARPPACPSVVRELVVTDGIVDGTWRFRYEQGLISCWREGVFIGRAHVPGINRELYGYTLRAATEWMECTSLTVRTNATVRKPTEAEQETWKKILNRDDRLRKLRSGEFDPAEFQTMEARREQYLEGSDQSNLPFVTLEMLRLRDEVAELLKALPVEPPDPRYCVDLDQHRVGGSECARLFGGPGALGGGAGNQASIAESLAP
jgi:hypothetical protein